MPVLPMLLLLLLLLLNSCAAVEMLSGWELVVFCSTSMKRMG
jgi:hypothetical protein